MRDKIRGAVRAVREWATRNQPEDVVRRRPTDAVRAVVAAVLLVPLTYHAGHLTLTEEKVVELFESIPQGARTLFLILYQLAALWALGLLVVTVLLLRRWRLARDLAVAGGVTWVVGRLMAYFTHQSDLWNALKVTFTLGDVPRFPMVRVAVAFAVVLVASPHLTRPTRWIGKSIVGLLALTALYLGRGAPTDLIAALVLGWGVGSLVQYAFGTPVGRPTVAQVERVLRALHVDVTDVTMADDQPIGRARFFGTGPAGPVHIVALGRDEADAQWLARFWRYLAYRDAAPTLLPTRRSQVEYEAYLALLARDAGVDTPKVLVAGQDGTLALLVVDVAPGTDLYDLAPEAVTDDVLDATWHEVALLHEARVAHGKLDGRHVVVAGTRAQIVSYDYATSSARFRQTAGDVAQMLAATTAKVGAPHAADVAVRNLGADAVKSAIPVLQAAAISGWTHDALGGRSGLDDRLEELRTECARATDSEPPELRRLYRVHPRSILMAVGALLAVGFLLSRVGDPEVFWNTVKGANWWYVLVAIVLGFGTDAAFGITFLGNVPIRLPVWESIELQSAMSFSNLAVPVAADTALQIRFLQRNGLDLSSAVAAGGLLSTISEIIVQVGLLFLALWLAPDSIDFGRIDTGQIVVVALIVGFVVGVGAAVVFGVRKLRSKVLPPIRRAAITVWAAIRTPSRLALLISGNVVAQCLYAASLLSCLAAFGGHVNFWTLLALNIGISLIASLVPIPGGGTAVSAVGLAGMVTAFGVPGAAASAGVLAHQLAVTYIPAVPGWFATNDLVRKRML